MSADTTLLPTLAFVDKPALPKTLIIRLATPFNQPESINGTHSIISQNRLPQNSTHPLKNSSDGEGGRSHHKLIWPIYGSVASASACPKSRQKLEHQVPSYLLWWVELSASRGGPESIIYHREVLHKSAQNCNRKSSCPPTPACRKHPKSPSSLRTLENTLSHTCPPSCAVRGERGGR